MHKLHEPLTSLVAADRGWTETDEFRWRVVLSSHRVKRLRLIYDEHAVDKLGAIEYAACRATRSIFVCCQGPWQQLDGAKSWPSPGLGICIAPTLPYVEEPLPQGSADPLRTFFKCLRKPVIVLRHGSWVHHALPEFVLCQNGDGWHDHEHMGEQRTL